jgi:hypothetical protein
MKEKKAFSYSIRDEIFLKENKEKMFIGGHEKNIISDSVLLREALEKYLHWRSKVHFIFQLIFHEKKFEK